MIQMNIENINYPQRFSHTTDASKEKKNETEKNLTETRTECSNKEAN